MAEISDTTSSGSASRKVFQHPELIERIILHVDDNSAILKLQRLSRGWKEVIAKSAKIQRQLFFLATPKPPIRQPRDKNLLLASRADNFFNTIFECGVLIEMDTAFSTVSMFNRALCMTHPMNDRWLAPNASWKKMQIGRPPIRKIRWQVRQTGTPSIPQALPVALAQFEFPKGLTMGGFYDLVLGTKGYHCIIWPELWKDDYILRTRPPATLADAFSIQQKWAANRNDALTVIQTLYWPLPSTEHKTPPPGFSRESVWDPVDLITYHSNLKKLETLELTANVGTGTMTWEYAQPLTDTKSAMELFIKLARAPVEIEDSIN
ncbi:uncharacterized protein GGS22DRAFT_186804 [Annulohypoxylon maeteangense]|uniref:uncharacterized protein n=1 Tax=Annulohypoxylon maeteangense TaxID=1927788 RepID=UPI00200831CC|nr:uncharacterized protein GGS22DRAFT_186804 [Annulohypoxylon maeteangense]KAI0886731.1 hypothetical protein GGS22DRAFT_186804 [Annulohypoxylon maeteangense]